MLNRYETDELIERYCEGRLTPEELRIFEQWRDSDPELGKAIREHFILLEAFAVHASRSSLRKQLSRIHDEMETEQFRFRTPLRVVTGAPGYRAFFTRNRRRIAAAAALVVVAISSTLILLKLIEVGENKSQGVYQELRREVESIKKRQSAIINNINEIQESETGQGRTFTGSGFAFSEEGYVLTSYHVVADAATITLSNQQFEQLKARLVYSNPSLDMAVLKVENEGFEGFPKLPFSIRKSVADPGEKVYTLGYPREDLVFGEGSVSSYTGYEGDTAAYQISIPVNPGNSGGPLFDSQGNLTGIISGRNSGAEGASFAIKSKWIIDDIRTQLKIKLPSGNNLKGRDRSNQVKLLSDHIFMVKVTN